eukprot:6178793-Pleurochrysis_carterae.AAC.1
MGAKRLLAGRTRPRQPASPRVGTKNKSPGARRCGGGRWYCGGRSCWRQQGCRRICVGRRLRTRMSTPEAAQAWLTTLPLAP